MDAYTSDLKARDKLESSIHSRVNLYNPMSFYKGYQRATPPAHWRIHASIEQGDMASTVEMNLTLALRYYSGNLISPGRLQHLPGQAGI